MLLLPPGYEQDPGLRILARLESEHAGFEYTTRAFFDAHLCPGDIFVDVDAHIGTYSLAAATLQSGEVSVLAVEAYPLNAMTMMRQLALNGLQLDVELVCATAGAKVGFGPPPTTWRKTRILDLGAGLMSVALRLRGGSTYTPVDLIRYADATVLVDLNEGQFPEGEWDCALALELLEYIHDIPALLVHISRVTARLVCTYRCAEEGTDPASRRAKGYFNDFDRGTIEAMLNDTGWRMGEVESHDPYTLFVCSR